MSSPRVVAVVVAYNRRDLLREALDALMLQSRPLDAVVVVDNASTDGSADLARGTGCVEVLALTANTGGAGGFAVGIAHAVAELGADLVWAMDDDTIPEIDALAALLAARDAHPGTSVWGSRVVWTDGSDHPMNTPRPRPLRSAHAADGSFEVRSTSFVSMLVEASSVRRVGLPIADYFIWNDDFEYSTRLLRGQRGAAQDQGARLDRHRPRGAVLLRGAQQALDAPALALPRRVGEGALRRIVAAALGTHLPRLGRPGAAGRRGPSRLA